MIRHRALTFFAALLAAAVCSTAALADDDAADSAKADAKAEATADANARTLEMLKKAGWKGPKSGVKEKALEDERRRMDNPIFSKSEEELRAMGMSDKQIAEIARAKEQRGKHLKKVKGVEQLSAEAAADPGSKRVKKAQKASLKRAMAEERREQALGHKDAEAADDAERKRKAADSLGR